MKTTGKKAQTKASQKLQTAQDKALAKTLKASLGKKGAAAVAEKQGGIQAAEKTGLIRRRGPRKKKDVVQQSDVPATVSSRLARQTSKSSFKSYHRRVDSKISFTSTERAKRMHQEA